MNIRFIVALLLGSSIFINASCKKNSGGGGTTPPIIDSPIVVGNPDIESWLTKNDQTAVLQKQGTVLSFGTTSNAYPSIDVDSAQVFQSIDGFGYTFTSGSATLINALSPALKASLLQELFGNTASSIGISYLRIAIGASDLSASVYTYDDMPAGETDPTLAHFSLDPDRAGVIAVLKEILAINPAIKIIATPWTSPVWMKDNGSSLGGSLKPEYYNAYAQYFVKYIQQMAVEGIAITAITPQNEPLNPNNNPSLQMLAEQQRDFIKNSLGPAFQTAGITTKIIAYDHNCDRPDYATTILSDPAANAFVDGSAFHLYAGSISALSTVHSAYPNKNLYFTEQYTASTGDFGGDLKWHVKNVIIGSMRNWSKVAMEWNLANDASYGPHTDGGCTTCKGALTLGSAVSRNVAYYIVAHASKFVPAGSVRIASGITGNLQSVAFLRADGKKVLLVENDGDAATFNIRYKGKWSAATLPAGAVATYIW